MRFLPALLLFSLAASTTATASRPAPRRGAPVTLLQTGTPYDAKSNLQVDLALVAADEGEGGLRNAAANVRSWRDRGYQVWGMGSLARVYAYYMKGGWRTLDGQTDGGGHDGEIQRDRFGDRFGPHEFMLTPSARLIEHKKLWADTFLKAGVQGMVYEEPDLFMDGGYEEQFKREWEAFYHEPWQPPHSSLAARVKAERLRAHLGYRSYRTLSEFCKARGGKDFRFMVATHSLPAYMLSGVTFNYWDTLSLPSVDQLQAQVWTGTAKTPVLYEGRLQERLFENAFVDYSYAANLAEATGKPVVFNLDPYEDEEGLSFEFYRRGFERTLVASLMFPTVKQWELLPWPNRIYGNNRIPPLYGTELQNVLTAMTEMAAEPGTWKSAHPRTGILFSETALQEIREPQPSNPQSLFALALPLLNGGVPLDIVPLEGVLNRRYLDRFRILFLSYDSFKPRQPEYHAALAAWVKRGGSLVILGGRSAYNVAPSWWRKAGWDSPTAHLLAQLGVGSKSTVLRTQSTPTQLASHRPRELGVLFAGLRGADHLPRAESFVPNGGHPELNYFHSEAGPGRAQDDLRFSDGRGTFTYRFKTVGLRSFKLRVDVANTYAIEASTDERHWTELANSFKEAGREIRDGSNRRERELDLNPYLGAEAVYLRFSDPVRTNGWGPAVRRMTLLPERVGKIPTEEPPLNLRDAYAASYTGLSAKIQVGLDGSAGLPVVFGAHVGKGKVLTLGAPPALFGASAKRGDLLRKIHHSLCNHHGSKAPEEGSLHLIRGRYHVVYAPRNAERVAGRYLDVLSPELDLLIHPEVAAGTSRLLLKLPEQTETKVPSLLFASHRASEAKFKDGRLEFTVEGPERIPAACRLFLPPNTTAEVTCTRTRDGAAVPLEESRTQWNTLYLRFPNQEHGVRVSVSVRPKA